MAREEGGSEDWPQAMQKTINNHKPQKNYSTNNNTNKRSEVQQQGVSFSGGNKAFDVSEEEKV